MTEKKPQENVNKTIQHPLKSALIASYLESWCDYGFIGAKIIIQAELSLSKNPLNYYRGIVAFQASLIPSVMTQAYIEELFFSRIRFASFAHHVCRSHFRLCEK